MAETDLRSARGVARRSPGGDAGSGRQNLLAEPRRMKILEWLQEEGSARVRDLSAAFAVSEATIRQDLERLDADGYITREHGGAYLKSVPQQVESMSLHHVQNMDRKQKIGQAAAALVGRGDRDRRDAEGWDERRPVEVSSPKAPGILHQHDHESAPEE